jgi:hypothetical protein
MTAVRVTLDVTLLPNVSPEWFAEKLFDQLCANMDLVVPDAVDSVDSYDFRKL